MHRPSHLCWLTAILTGAMALLSACQTATPPAAQAIPTAQAVDTIAPTATALPAATATLIAPAPTSALPPTLEPVKPTEMPPAITPLPGMALYTHPLIFDHIFQVDPAEWQRECDHEKYMVV